MRASEWVCVCPQAEVTCSCPTTMSQCGFLLMAATSCGCGAPTFFGRLLRSPGIGIGILPAIKQPWGPATRSFLIQINEAVCATYTVCDEDSSKQRALRQKAGVSVRCVWRLQIGSTKRVKGVWSWSRWLAQPIRRAARVGCEDSPKLSR